MTRIDVTVVDQVSSGGTKRELATQLTDGLSSLDRAVEPGNRSNCRN